MLTAQQIIERYELEPLDQEGGYFRQAWHSGLRVENDTLCSRYSDKGSHPMGTLIYFLLTEDSFSAMHRLPTAEHWFYHLGDPAEMLLLYADGGGELLELGPDVRSGQHVHVTTPIDCWQGTKLLPVTEPVGYMFCSCVMVPGFEWSDFELGQRELLCDEYPEFTESIMERSRVHAVKGAL